MSLAVDVQLIDEGLFGGVVPAGEVEAITVGDRQVFKLVNWRSVRAALEAVKRLDCWEVGDFWEYYLDERRFPPGKDLEMSSAESNRFGEELESLRRELGIGLAILKQVLPDVPLGNVGVSLDVGDLPRLSQGVLHVNRVAQLAAVDDAIQVSSVEAGSLELTLVGGLVSSLALDLAVCLSKVLLGPVVKDRARAFLELFKKLQPDVALNEDVVEGVVGEEVREEFWEGVGSGFLEAVEKAGHSAPEARTKVNQAAREIVDNSAKVGAVWRRPVTVIYGLPGGAWAELEGYDSTELGRVFRVLMVGDGEASSGMEPWTGGGRYDPPEDPVLE